MESRPLKKEQTAQLTWLCQIRKVGHLPLIIPAADLGYILMKMEGELK
jgi:hypothetical protein